MRFLALFPCLSLGLLLGPSLGLGTFAIGQSNLQAAEISDAVNGTYHFAAPERGAKNATIQFGQLGNKHVLAVAKGPGMPPAVYTMQMEESSTLQTAVFMNTGLYILQYDADTFVIVQPDGILGRKVWQKIGYTNFYSKDPAKLKTLTLEKAQEFAIGLSKKIMNQETGTMAHAGGTYHLAVPMEKLGKKRSEFSITFVNEPKKALEVETVPGKASETYELLPKESAIAGVDIYRHATSYYLFDLQDGVLLYTFANAGGLGKNEWGKSSYYNVISNNKAYIRQVLNSKEKQDLLDKQMATWFKGIKDAFIAEGEAAAKQKVKEQQLPARGMTDATLEAEALAATKRWAAAWQWKETIQGAYFTSSDWSIQRNPLSGIITGRSIRGIATMTHPDGRNRFQYVAYRQDYDGTNYMNLQMTGVGPIYDILPENMVIPTK